MNPEETEWGFANAGWQVPGPTRYPIFCNDADMPIVSHEQYARGDDPVFEILAGGRMLSHWVRLIITPRQAAVLLEARGSPPEAQRSNSHKRR